MTPEQFFPFRWVLHGVSRVVLARHILSLPREYRKKCLYEAHRIGVYPIKGFNHEDSQN